MAGVEDALRRVNGACFLYGPPRSGKRNLVYETFDNVVSGSPSEVEDACHVDSIIVFIDGDLVRGKDERDALKRIISTATAPVFIASSDYETLKRELGWPKGAGEIPVMPKEQPPEPTIASSPTTILDGTCTHPKVIDLMNLDAWVLDNTSDFRALEYDKWRTRYRQVGASMTPYLKNTVTGLVPNASFPRSWRKRK